MLVLAHAASQLGNGSMELTSRGNVQFRAVTDGNQLAERLADAGLLPSLTHERVRNILASPLSGRIGGLADVRTIAEELDRALCAVPELKNLPGRTLFALDDGRGDVAGLEPDFAVQARSPEQFALLLAGRDCGVRIGSDIVVTTLVDAAKAFLALRNNEWRLAELRDGPARVLDVLGFAPAPHDDLPVSADAAPPIGWLPQDDGRVALGGAVALGTLPARLGEFLAEVGKPLVVTPWRSIVVCDLDDGAAETVVRVLAPMGLIFDADSPWIDASACTGLPGCEKSSRDVRADLRDAVDSDRIVSGQRQHWSGCERRCGKPKGDVLDVVAGPDGYRVS